MACAHHVVMCELSRYWRRLVPLLFTQCNPSRSQVAGYNHVHVHNTDDARGCVWPRMWCIVLYNGVYAGE
jgi:hypothetical protein